MWHMCNFCAYYHKSTWDAPYLVQPKEANSNPLDNPSMVVVMHSLKFTYLANTLSHVHTARATGASAMLCLAVGYPASFLTCWLNLDSISASTLSIPGTYWTFKLSSMRHSSQQAWRALRWGCTKICINGSWSVDIFHTLL